MCLSIKNKARLVLPFLFSLHMLLMPKKSSSNKFFIFIYEGCSIYKLLSTANCMDDLLRILVCTTRCYNSHTSAREYPSGFVTSYRSTSCDVTHYFVADLD